MSLSNYLESAVINWMKGSAMPTAPATLYVALFTADPGEAAGGTECSYAGYARVAVTLSATPSPVSNTAAVAFAAVAGSGITVTAVALCDASTGGNQLAYDTAMTDKAIAVGDVPEFAIGALQFTLD